MMCFIRKWKAIKGYHYNQILKKRSELKKILEEENYDFTSPNLQKTVKQINQHTAKLINVTQTSDEIETEKNPNRAFFERREPRGNTAGFLGVYAETVRKACKMT